MLLLAIIISGGTAIADQDLNRIQIEQSRGVDQRVNYRSLEKLGPWDDRNYQLTGADLKYLSPNEHELHNQLPAFFRVELRKRWPHLRKSGPAQYPRAALQLFLLKYGGLMRNGKIKNDRRLRARRPSDANKEVQLNTILGANEITVAINPANPQVVIAGANNVGGQEMYYSTNGGVTWTVQGVLPNTCCDPTIDWSADGSVAYVGALSGAIGVSTWRSFDNGQTWVDRVDITLEGSDKEFIHVDRSPTSPFQDNLYVTYHNGNTMQFARSTNQGLSYEIQSFNAAPFGIGSDITTDANGNVYYAYDAFGNQTITLLKSTDGGATFGAPITVASTNGIFDFPIPSMDTRNAWIYVTADADRSGGPFDGSVYLAWTDVDGPESAIAAENHTRIQVAYSRDGGATWTLSTPHPTADINTVDRWNQWLSVDESGNVHVVFYDTRNSVNRSGVDLYYTYSTDGGVTWSIAERVSSATSANLTDLQEFGDYNGISVIQEKIVSTWTDNRDGPPNAKDVYADDAVNVVAAPGYTLSAGPISLTACASTQLPDISVSVGSVQGFADPVTLNLTNLPAGFSGGFTVNPVTPAAPPNPSLAQVSVAAVATGNYNFDISATTASAGDKSVNIDVSISASVPTAPTLSQPANGATNVTTAPSFDWADVPGAASYMVEIDDDPAFGSIDFSLQTQGSALIPTVSLNPTTTYYWRVGAVNSCGAGPLSGAFSFTTSAVVCGTGFAIPDANPNGASQTIVVNSPAQISDLDVLLQASHTWVGDLTFGLTHLDTGTVITLIDRPGVPNSQFGCSNVNIDVTLDDEGTQPVEDQCAVDPALFGNAIPNQALSAFDGESAAGSWQLFARDSASGDSGSVTTWCLIPAGVDTTSDQDNDGVPDVNDQCPGTPRGEPVDWKGCSFGQLDADRDGVSNALDNCPRTPIGSAVSDDGCSTGQIIDSDADGVVDAFDHCPDTPLNEQANAVGCSTTQLDSDQDGVSDNVDSCPLTNVGDTVDLNGCSENQLDDDGDGFANALDACPNTIAGAPVQDSGCSLAQLQEDYDGDGVINEVDLCPNTAPGASVDANGCSALQPDPDQDGILDEFDNCILIANPAQLDSDNDGYGNACDADLNNDNIVSILDLHVLRSLFGRADAVADLNGDGIVDQDDADILIRRMGQPPGPSGIAP